MRGLPAARVWASGVRTLKKRKATHWRGLTVLWGILTLGLPSPQKRKLMVTQSPHNIHGTKSTSPLSLGPNISPGAWLHLLYTPHRVQDCGSAQRLGCPSCPFPDCSYLFCGVSAVMALECLSQPFPQLFHRN